MEISVFKDEGHSRAQFVSGVFDFQSLDMLVAMTKATSWAPSIFALNAEGRSHRCGFRRFNR